MNKEQKIKTCKRYSNIDSEGHVHCCDCPLVVDIQNHLCKMNAHYDRKNKQWISNSYVKVVPIKLGGC